jgi:hypothetical protein
MSFIAIAGKYLTHVVCDSVSACIVSGHMRSAVNNC